MNSYVGSGGEGCWQLPEDWIIKADKAEEVMGRKLAKMVVVRDRVPLCPFCRLSSVVCLCSFPCLLPRIIFSCS